MAANNQHTGVAVCNGHGREVRHEVQVVIDQRQARRRRRLPPWQAQRLECARHAEVDLRPCVPSAAQVCARRKSRAEGS